MTALLGGATAALAATFAALVVGCGAAPPTTTPLVRSSAVASASAATPSPSHVPATRPTFGPIAPGLTVRIAPAGPGLIAVSAEAAPSASASWAIELERHEADAASAVERLTPSKATSIHSAAPGASYLYRFRAAGGAWSDAVEVHTAVPAKAPAAPMHLVVRSNDAFSAALAWEGDASDAAGFDIEVTTQRGATRASVVDPDQRAFVHLGRRPGATYGYRVRSFNPAGVSEWSPKAEITLPKLSAPAALSNKLAPCTTLPATAPAGAFGSGRDTLRAAPDELVNEPDANDPLLRHFFGRARGCLRSLGHVRAQADIRVVDGVDADPFPMLSVIAGAGQFVGAEFVFLRFDGTAYAPVHEVLLCGDAYPSDGPSLTFGQRDGDDPRTFQPPFDACQDDLDLASP